MKYFKKIKGKRIYLSPLSIDDASLFASWMCDRSTTDGIKQTCKVMNVLLEEDWINKMLEKGDYCFSIVLDCKDILIGTCSISDIDFISGTATIGIFIGDEKYRNNGYGSEAIGLLLDYGFNFLRLNNIDLKVFSFNERAINCYKKCGFKEYGRRHDCYFLDGKYCDEIFMEVLLKDFKKN